MSKKRCSKCRKRKAVEAFYKNAYAGDGLQTYCKQCITKANAQKYAANPNHYKEIHRKWYAKKHTEGYRLWRKRALAKRHGLTVLQLEELEAKASGKCQICQREAERLNIDHCHRDGRVRGLLCRLCNTGLGHFRDDPLLLRKAATYLLQV